MQNGIFEILEQLQEIDFLHVELNCDQAMQKENSRAPNYAYLFRRDEPRFRPNPTGLTLLAFRSSSFLSQISFSRCRSSFESQIAKKWAKAKISKIFPVFKQQATP